MLYTAVRKYSIMPVHFSEVMQRIVGEFLPIISDLPDYVAYYAVRVGTSEMLTISIFSSQVGAEELNPIALDWVQMNIARFVEGKPEITIGRVFAGSVGSQP